MWILILLICSLPVSGALSAEKYVTGVVGRAITINCHYEAKYRSHTKYWCDGLDQQCSVLVEAKQQHRQNGRVSITDNPERGIFNVTMENLHPRDTGWYGCGIIRSDHNLIFKVYLQVYDEPRYISETSVTESMKTSPSETPVTKSMRTSRYKTPAKKSMRTSHSETPVTKSMRASHSETPVTKLMRASHSETPVTKSMRASHSETPVTKSMRASHSETSATEATRASRSETFKIRFNDTRRKNIQSISAKSYIIWKVGRWPLFALLGIWTIAVTWFTRGEKRSDRSDPHHLVHE